MFWRRKREEEIEELEQFVESMKRGQTRATGDSLLETLRQIHDRRETPVASHDHKRMLQERLRRQMALRDGRPVDDSVPAPVFVAPAPRSPVLRWAAAASLVAHVGVGAAVLPNLSLDPLVIAWRGEQAEEVIEFRVPEVIYLPPPPKPQGTPGRTAPPSERTPSAEVDGSGRGDGGVAPLPRPGIVPAVASSPIAPPVAPGAVPVIASYSPSIERLADRDLTAAAETLPTEPPALEPPRKARPSTMTEVMSSRYEAVSEGAVDVKPKILYAPRPDYPEKALRYQVAGKVRVSVVFGADGAVRDVKVVHSLGYGLDEAAVDAARRIKFTPATRGGLPVSVRTTVDIYFDLH